MHSGIAPPPGYWARRLGRAAPWRGRALPGRARLFSRLHCPVGSESGPVRPDLKSSLVFCTLPWRSRARGNKLVQGTSLTGERASAPAPAGRRAQPDPSRGNRCQVSGGFAALQATDRAVATVTVAWAHGAALMARARAGPNLDIAGDRGFSRSRKEKKLAARGRDFPGPRCCHGGTLRVGSEGGPGRPAEPGGPPVAAPSPGSGRLAGGS